MTTDSNNILKSMTQGFIQQAFLDTLLAPTTRLLILLQNQSIEENPNAIHPQKRKEAAYYLSQIIRREGILGLWKGNLIEILQNSADTAISTLFAQLYEPLFLQENSKDNFSHGLGEFVFFSFVNCSALVFTYPLKVIRTKFSVLSNSKEKGQNGFKGIIDCIKRIWDEGGFFGFYKGFSAAFAHAINSALFLTLERTFLRGYKTEIPEEKHHKRNLVKALLKSRVPGRMVWTYLKRSRTVKYVGKQTTKVALKTLNSLLSSAMLYPYKVIQTRMILNENPEMKKAMPQEFLVEILEKEGFRGLYSGVTVAAFEAFGTMTMYPVAKAFARKFANGIFDKDKIIEEADQEGNIEGKKNRKRDKIFNRNKYKSNYKERGGQAKYSREENIS